MTDKPRAADPETTGSAPGGSAPDGQADERVVIRDEREQGQADGPAETAPAAGAGDDAGTADAATGDGPVEVAEAGEDVGTADDAVVDEPAGVEAEPAATDGAESTGDAGTDPLDAIDGVGDPEPATPVIDDTELAEVLEAEKPSGTDGPVVDAPAKPIDPASEADGRGPLGAELEALRGELDERTRDLQRVSAEYANYRKRVDRDRGLVTEQATGAVLTALLPILDDLDRAREHGDLVGPFGTVAEQLTTGLGKFGLTAFGEKGDPFDPTRHEAVAHQTSADVTEPTCVEVMRRGYLLGDRLLRPALVAVADPE
ncbi:nucleotide exchange factor GrpE [Plantactinospora sp. CA-290183]|uniref:nucleotide exchange factor GrpE n=1 Tax=Plantactinospora sp. CA-290183 TaxID=3240006 RepID=UPI003D8BC29A